MVMQAADFRNLNYLPQFRVLNGTKLRCIFRKRQARTIFVIIAKIESQDFS